MSWEEIHRLVVTGTRELDAPCCGIHILPPESLPSDVFAHLNCPGPKSPARLEELWAAALKMRPGSSSPPLGALHHMKGFISQTGETLFVGDPRELMR